MSRAGYVLVGGRSERMGRDKALLAWRGATLVEHVAGEVRRAAGSVALVGAPERYAALGLPAIGDRYPGCGPIGGILTILETTAADWNLVAACDMPHIDAAYLCELLAIAEASAADCVVPLSAGDRYEPLCAVYHRRAAPALSRALAANRRKLVEAVLDTNVLSPRSYGAPAFTNVNTPEEWSAL